MNPESITNIIENVVRNDRLHLQDNPVCRKVANEILIKIAVYKRQGLRPEGIVSRVLSDHRGHKSACTSFLRNGLLNYRGMNNRLKTTGRFSGDGISSYPDPFLNLFETIKIPVGIDVPVEGSLSQQPHRYRDVVGAVLNSIPTGDIKTYNEAYHFFPSFSKMVSDLTDYFFSEVLLHSNGFFVLAKKPVGCLQACYYVAGADSEGVERMFLNCADCDKSWVTDFCFATTDGGVLNEIPLTGQVLAIFSGGAWIFG